MSQTAAAADVSTPVQPSPFVQPLLKQLAFQHFALHVNVKGITHEESLRSPLPAASGDVVERPIQGGGRAINCLNWVLGHIVYVRQAWLTAVLGQAPVFDADTISRYRRGSDPLTDGTLAMPFDELLAAYDRAQGPLVSGMAQLTPERLAEKAPFSPGNDPRETVGSLVATLCFHESYHIGQTALLRRLAGHAGAIA